MEFEFYATVDSDSVGPTQHPHMPDVPYLLPASSWSRKGMRAPTLPRHVWQTAADCGGFVATVKWGEYRYTLDDYVAWLQSWRPSPPLWAAMMDYCCEPAIASDKAAVRRRQQATTEMAHRTWRQHRDVPWEWVPTIQGWDPDDYREHALMLAPLIEEMATQYAVDSDGEWAFRVGLGTLCARASVPMIREIVGTVHDVLDTGVGSVRLHLWGVKLGALQSGLPDAVVSADSAAWNGRFGTSIPTAAEQGGLTQRAYGYRVALPAYLAKVHAAIRQGRDADAGTDAA